MPGFSLWMMPPLAVRERLRALIEDLSRRAGTPPFEPHLTLCGVDNTAEGTAIARVQPLATRLAPLPIRLTEIGTTAEYYRCLFARAEPTPVLAAAYHEACHALSQAPGDFMPHVSLVYGDLSATDKERLIAVVGRRVEASFTISRLALYDTVGSPPEWRCVADFPLRGA